jgi:FkbM family methyltransferase
MFYPTVFEKMIFPITTAIRDIRESLIFHLKNLLYGKRGEPYAIAGHTLYFLPGTRPVRVGYADSECRNVRYDALQVKIFSNELSEGDVAIDIGGHAGQYCLIMAAKCGQSGRVVTFEPDPYARKKLAKNIALNSHINPPLVEPLAVSDKPGEAILFSLYGNAQSSLARSGTEFNESHQSEQIKVPLITLDKYIAENNLPEPRWLKIDAEGAEINILRGAQKVLEGDTHIICEIHPYAWPEFGVTLEELKHLVTAAGRRIRYLDEDSDMGDHVEYGTVLLERIQ